MKDPLEEMLDSIHEIEDLKVRSKFIIIAARMNRQASLYQRVMKTLSETMQDIRLNVAALQHDLAATRRERDDALA